MRYFSLFVFAIWLLGCGAPPAAQVVATLPAQAANSTTVASMATAPATAFAVTQLPSAVATAEPTALVSPTEVAPSVSEQTPASSVPTASSPVAKIAAESAVDAPFDASLQAAALLPEYQGDLARAAEWNSYTIDATIDPVQRTLAGTQRVEYTNRDSVALEQLYFHLYPNLSDFGGQLAISALSVDGAEVAPVFELRNYLLRVNLPQPLAPGAKTTVLLAFRTKAPLNASQSKYGAFNRESGVLALASAYPVVAVVRGGIWDIARPDPKGDFVNSETSLYDVTLHAPGDWKLVTTGTAIDYQSGDAGQTTRFVSGPQRDFTIAATQLESISTEVDGTQVTSYYRSGKANAGKIAMDVAANSVRIYNQRYGPYMLRELDVIAIAADQFLGVEYPGLTMIDAAIYDNTAALETTVAHEVGHMWFYSIVGNDVQRESWLDEAMASYSQIIYKEEVFGSDAANRELDEFRRRYRANLAAGRDAAVAQDNHNFNRNYVALVYGKAVLFVQVLRNQLGEQGFDQFLHSYYQQHRYGYVSGADMLATANATCTCSLDSLYQDWIERAVRVDVP